MNKPTIHGKRIAITASSVLDAIGSDLLRIKMEDGLRWSDIGSVMHKSEDQAAKYADATASMDVVAYTLAEASWGSRFTGTRDKLLRAAREEANPHHAQSCILKAALALAEALEDGDLSIEELQANRTKLVNARDAIDAQLARLCVRSVA